MKIKLSSGLTFESVSASKKMQANAVSMLGKTGVKMLTALEALSKEKMLVTSGLDTILSFLKTSDNMMVEKVAGSVAGKKLAVSLKALAKAKTLAAISGALKKVKPLASMKSKVDPEQVDLESENYGNVMGVMLPILPPAFSDKAETVLIDVDTVFTYEDGLFAIGPKKVSKAVAMRTLMKASKLHVHVGDSGGFGKFVPTGTREAKKSRNKVRNISALIREIS